MSATVFALPNIFTNGLLLLPPNLPPAPEDAALRRHLGGRAGRRRGGIQVADTLVAGCLTALDGLAPATVLRTLASFSRLAKEPLAKRHIDATAPFR